MMALFILVRMLHLSFNSFSQVECKAVLLINDHALTSSLEPLSQLQVTVLFYSRWKFRLLSTASCLLWKMFGILFLLVFPVFCLLPLWLSSTLLHSFFFFLFSSGLYREDILWFPVLLTLNLQNLISNPNFSAVAFSHFLI